MSASYVYTPTERASRRLGLFLLFVIGVVLMIALYYVKTRAQTARDAVASLERQIAKERAAISVLSAERAVLSSPERLARLSQDHLGLNPVRVEATRTLEELALADAAEDMP